MYIAIRSYAIVPGKGKELLERVYEDFVPLISHSHGFMAYDARQIGSQYVVTTSTFHTQADAEASILRALRWAQENIGEFTLGLPLMSVQQTQLPDCSAPLLVLHRQKMEKTLVLDLTYEVLHPAALGEHASLDPQVSKMVYDVRTFLAQMWADPARRDLVIYRFEAVIGPEAATRGLSAAD